MDKKCKYWNNGFGMFHFFFLLLKPYERCACIIYLHFMELKVVDFEVFVLPFQEVKCKN